MILYVLGVLAVAGAAVADHYQTHIFDHIKKRIDKIKQDFIDGYNHQTRDKLAGLRAIDETEPYNFDKALDQAVYNIQRGKMIDLQEKIKKNYYNNNGKELTTVPSRAPRAKAKRAKRATTTPRKAAKANPFT